MSSSEAQEKAAVMAGTEAAPERYVSSDRRGRRSGPRWRRRVRRVLRRVKWGSLLLVIVAGLAVFTVTAFALAADSNSRVQTSLQSLTRVMNSLSDKNGTELTLADFNRLASSLKETRDSLATASARLGFLRPLNSVYNQINPLLNELEAAEYLAQAARQMLSGLEPTLFFLVSGNAEDVVLGSQISSGERVVELLEIGRGQFVQASENLNRAQLVMQQLDFSMLSPDLILSADDLQAYYQQLVQTNDMLLAAPDLLTNALGLSEERTYLVLSQNSDELRPSGGYVSTYGWLTIRNGRVTNYNYSPTTDRSPNPPPAALASTYPVPDWWIRYGDPVYAAWDGSWYADFPSSAEMAMWYYNAGNNPNAPVYGVIAIDIVGFETLLNGLGAVTVDDYGTVVTGENFRNVVYGIREAGRTGEIQTTSGIAGNPAHKEFLAALYQSIFDEWQRVGDAQTDSNALVGSLLQGIQEKHIMIYFADPDLNHTFSTLGWSGAQTPALDHDYVMVADANLGNKSNNSIFRQLTYDVDIQPEGTLSSRLTVGYDYPDRVASTDPAVDARFHGQIDYSNLLQVFVPYQSQIESTDNLNQEPRVVDLPGHTLFVSRVRVDYDNSERFQYSYQTPVLIEQVGPYQRYRLLIQKQPGARANAVNVQVTLPARARAIGITPAPATSYNLERPILEFRLALDKDQWVEIIYELDE